jgi:MSHA biogenesis protein MshQ
MSTATGQRRAVGAALARRGARLAVGLLCALATLVVPFEVDAQISFIGVGAQAASESSGSITPALPAGTAAGDLAVLVVAGRPGDASQPGAPAGWTLRSSVLQNAGGNDLRIMTFYRVLAAGDANPSVGLPGGWVGSDNGMSGQIAVWRGVDTAAPFDVADATSSSNPNDVFTAPAVTTATVNAFVVSAVATSDDNDVRFGSAASFTARMSGAGYDTVVGDDHSMALADKLQATAGLVDMPQWQQNVNDPDRWAAITFALRQYVPPPPPAMRLSFTFDESVWSGVAGQVVDASPYGLHGTSVGGANTANTTPAVATNPGTCRYGDFDGVDDYVQVADHAALDITSELTVAAWIYLRTTPSELHTIVSKDTNYEYHIDNNRRLYWWWNDSNGNTRSLTTTTQIALSQWHHVAVTYASGAQRMYIDGVVQGATGNYTGTLATNALPLFVGTDWNLIARAFDGYIDEVRVVADALSQAEIQALRDETRPCANTARFTITHNAFGIHCVAEAVTVDVVDSITGTPLLNYNAAVQLDTQSSYGTWALVTGSGAFSDGTPGDGIATYTWPLGQSQARFTLYYPEGPPSLDVDVFQSSNTGIRDNDSEGALVFSPNGFTVTAATLANPFGVVVPFATSPLAGANFTLQLAAFGQTATDPVCGIIEGYAGVKALKFWSQYVDPGTGTRNATIDGVAAAATEGAAQAQTVTFTQGQAAVTAKYKDVGLIRLLMKDDTTMNAELPAGITGATASFVVRPYDFVLSDIADPAGSLLNPQAADASGAVFLAAGAPFRATVTVRDAEGSTTPNFGREALPETVRLDTELVAPAGGASPVIGATVGFGPFAGGVATGTDFTWSEVGIVRAVPGIGDGDYLSAGDVTGTASERIGRFIPSHFVVALNSPLFTAACYAGGFTYQGQSFGYTTAPVITATAVAVSGSTTTNYTGSFFKLTNTTLAGRNYVSAGGALNTSGLPATDIDPAIASPSGGVATLTFSSGSGLVFVKGSPQAPFEADVQLSIEVQDGDGVAAVGAAPLGNPVTFGSVGGIAFTGAQVTNEEIRYGRVRVGTAVGSELVDLAVPMRAEYYASAGAGFVTNVQDTCATAVALAFPAYTENLNAGETCVLDSGAPGASAMGCAAAAASPYREPPLGGDFNLRLAAPGAGNQGSVALRAAVPAWLRFDWDTSTAGNEDPTGQATFGIYGGERRVIYTREVY